jgi:hypothetical protein
MGKISFNCPNAVVQGRRSRPADDHHHGMVYGDPIADMIVRRSETVRCAGAGPMRKSLFDHVSAFRHERARRY